MERLFVYTENAATYSAGNEGQKVCGDLPETTAFKSYAMKHERKSQYANYSDLPAVSFLRFTHSEAPEGTQRLAKTFSLPKMMSTATASPCWSETHALHTATTPRGVANFRARALALYVDR